MRIKLKDFFQITDGVTNQGFNVTFEEVKEFLGIKTSGKAGMKADDVKKVVGAAVDKANETVLATVLKTVEDELATFKAKFKKELTGE